MKSETETKNLMVLEKADELAHKVYLETKKFPEEEFFGITLHLRKLALNVPIQIIEGVNKNERKDLKMALDRAIGKISEIKYLLRFSFKLNYLSKASYEELERLHLETDGLLWRFYNAF